MYVELNVKLGKNENYYLITRYYYVNYPAPDLLFLAPTLFHRGGALDLAISLTD